MHNYTIYSFQPLWVYELIKTNGFYVPQDIEQYSPYFEDDINHSFKRSYAWLTNEMNKREVQFNFNNQNLIWGWKQWAGKNKKKPDNRYKSVYDYMDEPYVLLTLSIPANRLLLSDYDAWHFVLNNWYFANEKKTIRFEKLCKEVALPNDIQQAQLQTIKEHSWQDIFDMRKARYILETTPFNQQIQATFFDILLSDIKLVVKYNNKTREIIYKK